MEIDDDEKSLIIKHFIGSLLFGSFIVLPLVTLHFIGGYHTIRHTLKNMIVPSERSQKRAEDRVDGTECKDCRGR